MFALNSCIPIGGDSQGVEFRRKGSEGGQTETHVTTVVAADYHKVARRQTLAADRKRDEDV